MSKLTQNFNNTETLANYLSSTSSQDKIQEFYSQVQETLNNFDSKVNSVVHQHEKDFLSAFRCVMHQVYNDMQQLKNQIDQQSQKLQKDEALTKLKESLQWFQNEAVSLSHASTKLHNKNEQTKARLHEVESENTYLKETLREVMRENKQLKEQKEKFTPEKSIEEEMASSSKYIQPADDLEELSTTFELPPQLVSQLQTIIKNKDKATQEIVNRYKRQLEAKNQKIKILTSQQSAAYLQKSELEQLFIDCVNEAKRKTLSRRGKSSSPNTSRLPAMFTSNEKRSLIENFLSDDSVISAVQDKLFPKIKEAKRDSASSFMITRKKSKPRNYAIQNGKLLINRKLTSFKIN